MKIELRRFDRMKSKKIAAFAASLLMAFSVAVTPVFAAEWSKTMIRETKSVSDDGTKITRCEVIKFDYSYYTTRNASADSKVTDSYIYKKATETASEEVIPGDNGKKAVEISLKFTKEELAAFAENGVTVRLKNLTLPDDLKDADAVLAGWASVKNDKVFESQTKAEKAKCFLHPDDEIMDLFTRSKGCTLYPVFRAKTKEEQKADALVEQKAEKVAVDKKGNEISSAKVNVNVKALAQKEVAGALKASGADASAAALYDITVTDTNGDEVKIIKGKTVTVRLDRPKIDGNVNFRLYHIDGSKAEEMEITVSDDAITFESSEFSPYVLTWTISSGVSDGSNPATGDDFNVVPILIIGGLALVAGIVVVILRRG